MSISFGNLPHYWTPLLATLWSLTEGTKVRFLYPLPRRQQRLSVFRLGLDYLLERFHSLKSKGLELFLAPDPPLLKTVVP